MEPFHTSSFTCPRCSQTVGDEYYGPCPACRDELRAQYAGGPRDDVAAASYEPKMNVTPNAVALKD